VTTASAAPPSARSLTFAPFRSPRYRAVWTGSLISNIGTWMEAVAIGYYVADTTGKASWSAIVGAAGFIPNGLLGPIGSAMADRLDRRRTIIIGQALAAIIAAIVAVWVGSGDATPAGLAVLALLSGSVFAFTFPSFQTTLPDLVPREHLTAAIGMSNAGWNLGRVLGPAAAAVAILVGGIEFALWCNAVSFLAVIVAVLIARISTKRGEPRPVFAALQDGLRFARTTPTMRRMLAVMIPTILIGSPFIAFVAQMATNVLDRGEGAVSALTTAQGVGAVIAAFGLGAVAAKYSSRTVLAAAVAGLSAALVAYAAAPNLLTMCLALLVVGVAYGLAFVSFSSIAQGCAPDEMRGRVLAVNSFVLGVGYPVGTLVQGAIADVVGLRWVTAGSGVLLLVVAMPALRALRRSTPV
jgi:MFS family permease